jgi:hypothetical protein
LSIFQLQPAQQSLANNCRVLYFIKLTTKKTKLRLHNITAKTALKFGSEALVLKKRDEQRLEAAQMKLLRHLIGITELDRERNQCVREKLGVQNTVLEIKQHATRVATTCRANGHRQGTQTGTEIQAKGKEKHRTP